MAAGDYLLLCLTHHPFPHHVFSIPTEQNLEPVPGTPLSLSLFGHPIQSTLAIPT
jgi:hypothetical protein